MSAISTTFSTVVRDGPWMCMAEMQASMSRRRWRTRAARSGARAPGAARVVPAADGAAALTAAGGLARDLFMRTRGNAVLRPVAGPPA